MAVRHTAIGAWLDALNMAEYEPLFRQYGGVEDLIYITESEISEMGIINSGHKAKIISSLRILKDKFQNGHVSRSRGSSPHHTVGSSCSTPNSPTTSCQDFLNSIISPEKLQSDLQKELSSDPLELRSRSWYHGNITRQKAESLVTNNGDFLIRDCISKPGDFVLTCRWSDVPLNFIINSIIGYCSPETLPTISYQFEEDRFPSIQQLIQHYQKHNKPVTVASEALLKYPVPRSLPLSYYDAKYGSHSNISSCFTTPNESPVSSPFITPCTSPRSSPNMSRRKVMFMENLPTFKKDKFEDVNNNSDGQNYSPPPCLDSLPIINVTPPGGMPRPMTLNYQEEGYIPKPVITHIRAGSAPANMSETLAKGCDDFRLSPPERVLPASESDLAHPAPPKPSRLPSFKYQQERITRTFLPDCFNHRQRKEKTDGSLAQDINNQEETPAPSLTCSSAKGSERTQGTNNFNIFKGLSVSQPDRRNQNARVRTVYSGTDHYLQSKTYRVVARSQSLQFPGKNKDSNHSSENKKSKKCWKLKSLYLRQTSKNELDLTGQEDRDNNNIQQIALDDPSNIHMTPQNITTPSKHYHTKIFPDTFKSNLLPKGYRVLDHAVLVDVKTILTNKRANSVALHLTKYDLALINVQQTELDLGVASGLELFTLPHGRQLRQDIIQRWENLRLFALATLLTAQTVKERAKMLQFWIQTCHKLRTQTGNLYSFGAIMAALNDLQIRRLTDTWLDLRQNHTSSAVVFDTKLRPEFLSLNDASTDIPIQDVCVPYITPVCQLLERDLESVLQEYYWEKELDPIASSMDVLLKHLEIARVISSHGDMFRVIGRSVIESMNFDPELAQILCPEFHILILRGDKDLGVNSKGQIEKLEQIFHILSQKCQKSGDNVTEN